MSKKKPEVVVEFYRYKHTLAEKTARFEFTTDEPEYLEIRGGSAEEINEKVQKLRDENDVLQYTPWSFLRIVSLEVI